MSKATSFLVYFIIGGIIVTTIHFVGGLKCKDPSKPCPWAALAGLAAGLPIGLISLSTLQSENADNVSHSYLFVTLGLALSILTFILVKSYTKISNITAVIIAVGVWVTCFILYYFISRKFFKSWVTVKQVPATSAK